MFTLLNIGLYLARNFGFLCHPGHTDRIGLVAGLFEVFLHYAMMFSRKVQIVVDFS